MAETSTIEPPSCFACGNLLALGDPVYEDVNEGLIHAGCCGPERESYAGRDGEPLKPGDPIPAPMIFGGAHLVAFKPPAHRGEYRNVYRRADGSERHGCTWSTREAAAAGREILTGETFLELRDMRNADSMALAGVGATGGARG